MILCKVWHSLVCLKKNPSEMSTSFFSTVSMPTPHIKCDILSWLSKAFVIIKLFILSSRLSTYSIKLTDFLRWYIDVHVPYHHISQLSESLCYFMQWNLFMPIFKNASLNPLKHCMFPYIASVLIYNSSGYNYKCIYSANSEILLLSSP